MTLYQALMYLCDEEELGENRSFGSVEGMTAFREKKRLERELFARRAMNNGR